MVDRLRNMINEIQTNTKVRLLFSILVFLIGIIAAISYICFYERTEVNSDYTDTLLWAYESIKGKCVYNNGFYYAYMLPFGGSLIMMIPVLLFGFTYKAHMLGMVLFVFILAAVLVAFYKMIFNAISRGFYLSGLSLLFFLCSRNMRLIFYGHIIQYSLGITMVCIALLIISKVLHSDITTYAERKKRAIYLSLLFLFTLLCMTNGVNIAPFFFAPVFIAVMLEAFLDKNCNYGDEKFKKTLLIGGLLIISGLMGFLLNSFLKRNIDTTYVDTLMSYRPVNEWFFSTRELLATWCNLGVGEVQMGEQIASLNGIRVGMMYIFSLLILVIPAIGVCCYNKINSQIIRIQVIAHHVILIVTWLTVSVIQTENIGHEWRWGGAFASAVITSVILVSCCIDNNDMRRWGILANTFILISAVLVVVYVRGLDKSYGANNLDRVKDTLLSNNLSYGYADFWDANAITMLSDDSVRVRAIELDVFEDNQVKERAVPYRYQTEEAWYCDQQGVDKYFVFLRCSAYDRCPGELKNAAQEIIEIDGGLGYILVYDHNIFKDGESIYDR